MAHDASRSVPVRADRRGSRSGLANVDVPSPGESVRTEWLEPARSRLREADPVLARMIAEQPNFDPRAWLGELPPMDLFGALLFQVTGQQLSVPTTRRILARVEVLFRGQLPTPTELLAVDSGV